jgi:hypothetical protein
MGAARAAKNRIARPGKEKIPDLSSRIWKVLEKSQRFGKIPNLSSFPPKSKINVTC